MKKCQKCGEEQYLKNNLCPRCEFWDNNDKRTKALEASGYRQLNEMDRDIARHAAFISRIGLCLLFALLVGCGGGDKKVSTAPSVSETAEQAMQRLVAHFEAKGLKVKARIDSESNASFVSASDLIVLQLPSKTETDEISVLFYDLTLKSAEDGYKKLQTDGWMGQRPVFNSHLVMLQDRAHSQWDKIKEAFLSL